MAKTSNNLDCLFKAIEINDMMNDVDEKIKKSKLTVRPVVLDRKINISKGFFYIGSIFGLKDSAKQKFVDHCNQHGMITEPMFFEIGTHRGVFFPTGDVHHNLYLFETPGSFFDRLNVSQLFVICDAQLSVAPEHKLIKQDIGASKNCSIGVNYELRNPCDLHFKFDPFEPKSLCVLQFIDTVTKSVPSEVCVRLVRHYKDENSLHTNVYYIG